MLKLFPIMTLPSLGPVIRPQAPRTAAPPPSQAEAPADRVAFQVDPHAPHPRLVIPSEGKPLNPHPVSGSRTARFMLAGGIVGGMGGGYVALGLLGGAPVAAASLFVGSAVLGVVGGYFASREGK